MKSSCCRHQTGHTAEVSQAGSAFREQGSRLAGHRSRWPTEVCPPTSCHAHADTIQRERHILIPRFVSCCVNTSTGLRPSKEKQDQNHSYNSIRLRELAFCHMNSRQEETIQPVSVSSTFLQAPPQGKGGKHHRKNMQTKGSELPPRPAHGRDTRNQAGPLEARTRSMGH